MISTVVTQSANAAQVLALIAIILFLVLAVWQFAIKSLYSGFLCIGFAFIAASIMWLA